MQIQVNSDKNITVDTRATRVIELEVNRGLKRFASKLTRVEVHLSDVNGPKFGAHAKRCLIEARPARHRPLAASDGARTVAAALRGALSKLQSSLQTFFGRLGERQSRPGTASAVVTMERPERAAPKSTKKKTVTKNGAGNGREPKKKGIYQARRNSWPGR